ncbi:palmitoyltransferase ZDHHC21 [Lates japonicus]|uniref:Palmitoyltransferase ZDHHC21 n=1 Tax=Lates japonicus TaxID=270547 RepID=A0AAD3MHP3_LATJO|nr:palmitoyltransferase ZDHHC21 [Lates japonicus]
MKLRLHFVVDPMGWLCISMVFGIWLYNTFFIPKLVLLPHYNEGHIPWVTVVCYYISSALCIAALFRASTADPGRLPVDPHIPHSEREHWELCNIGSKRSTTLGTIAEVAALAETLWLIHGSEQAATPSQPHFHAPRIVGR